MHESKRDEAEEKKENTIIYTNKLLRCTEQQQAWTQCKHTAE